MANKQVQEKLCTEPKDNPADALQFTIAFDDGLERQRTYGYINQEPKIKEEPVYSVSEGKQNNRECGRCSTANFTLQKGPPGKILQSKESDKNQNFGTNHGFAKRVHFVDQEDTDNEDEKYMVLNIEGNDSITKPYYMEGFINGK